MTSKYFGVALFGLGRAGTIHIHNLRKTPRAELIYIIEADLHKAKQLVEEYRLRDVEVVPPDQSDKVFNDHRVEAVLVATPTFTHQSIVTEALSHGKAVFCEKPVAQNATETRQCYEAAEKIEKPLMCSFNRRYDPTIMEIKDRVSSGEIGNVHVIKTCARDHPRPPNQYLSISGGFFHDCAVHDLDMVCWMVGEFPVEVHAYAHAYDADIRAMNDVDTAVMTLKFACGAIAIIDISRHATYGYDQRLEVFGMGGMIESKNQRSLGVCNYNDTGTHSHKLKHSFPQRYAESYVNALDHFFDVIEGKTKLDVTKTTTLQISRLASACEESSKTGRNIIMADFVEVDDVTIPNGI